MIEVVRAFMNEVSSAISKRGGRLSQVLQLVTTVFIIAAMALIFNYNILLWIMEWFGLTLEQIWFIPILWPSMIIQSLLGNTSNAIIYGLACLLLLGVSFLLGTYAREKYWVPKPINIDLGPRKAQHEIKASSLRKSVETFGETTLETWGMRYTGSIGDVEDYDIEIWYAPTQFGGILTSLSMEFTRDDTHHQTYELNSIKLTEEQQVPSSFLDLLESESDTDTDTDTDTEPTPDPANIIYDSITASPMTLEAGNPTTVTITVENTGDEQGTETKSNDFTNQYQNYKSILGYDTRKKQFRYKIRELSDQYNTLNTLRTGQGCWINLE
ncbi:hypothetical protein GF326_08455 [Candidatus Bathyarchaeota archaeon]|nr:hypothetical protein [Candidatus Bathyarchaeota archaeon]